MVKKKKVRDPYQNPWYAQALIYLVLAICSAICIYPLINVLAKSISAGHAIMKNPMMILPEDLTMGAYKYIVKTPVLMKSFGITVFATVVGTVMNLIITITCAYSLSRVRAPGNKFMLWMTVIPMLFGAGLVPTYILLSDLKLVDNVWVLIIPSLLNPMNALLVRNFFWSIPDSLSESAMIDDANAYYGEEHIDWEGLDVDIFHIGYILLLPELDSADEEYGTKMARLLHRVQEKGIKTSIDVVSESGDRFARLVTPALKYADYCIINELEAQQTTGVLLRDEENNLIREHLPMALKRLKELGVSTWAVIHCPELGCGIDETGAYVEVPSLKLPQGWIKGTVGAGDAFCAGVLYGAEMDMSMADALTLGACTAAASLREVSASDGVQRAEEVLKLRELYGA